MDRALRSVEAGAGSTVDALHLLVADPDEADHTAPRPIAEVAEFLGVSPATLRYYEKLGLVAVDRDASDRRIYSTEAVRRLVFLTRMRLSGMPITDLQRYVELVDAGAHTVDDRLDMLLEHRETIKRQIRELTLSLAATEYKIATYGGHTGD